jgi:hypothetical protein
LQPAGPDVVPPPQVTLQFPPLQAVVHEPLQVMLQVPPAQTTLEPAPTVKVHVVPEHVTLVPGPPVPEHVALAPHVNLAAALCEPKSHVCPEPQSQESPLQTAAPLHPTAMAAMNVSEEKASATPKPRAEDMGTSILMGFRGSAPEALPRRRCTDDAHSIIAESRIPYGRARRG